MTIKITQKAGVDGRLFGSVTNVDIVEALQKQGLEVEKAMIRMPAGPLKQVGDYPLVVAPHHDVVANITVSVRRAIRPRADLKPHRNTRKRPRRYLARPFAFSGCRENLSSGRQCMRPNPQIMAASKIMPSAARRPPCPTIPNSKH